MMLSRVGTIGIYNYNTKTGVVSSKDGTEEEFIAFFYDELRADETETVNGYDSRTKAGLKNLLDIWQQFAAVGKLTALPEAGYEASMEMAIHPIHVSRFREVSTEHYSFVPEPDIGKGGLRILINGESAGVFSVDDLKIRTDEKTGIRVMISEIVGGAWYDAIPVTEELERGLTEAMGVTDIPKEKLTGYYIGTHAGTGISYVMRPGDEGRGGKVLLQSEADVVKYNALAEDYYTKYPNLVSNREAGKIYASFEICGMMERTSTGIVKIGYDNISYNDNFDSKKNWSIMLSEATWELLEEWLKENRSSVKEYGELRTWTEILDSVGGEYERIMPKGYCSRGKNTMAESTIFHTNENLQYQRKLQKKREERELKERREQKERMEESLEEYIRYRRELREYYNEVSYQKKLAVSNGEPITSVHVKRPPVVSGLYEMIMMLGM